ncbi:right-handed parallel beta-helix repeat-containing protein [Paenibacillus silvisoli]|uniref:right-handed parallel beta-helix repeat-containing protein n=1 Tax=Paenibacillus silvisoli TaxID=3110539 RepID=UPI002805D40C|nr:right-handed parallel beta-helix repeat-containing protein [Paenibacillus silvisoli]
MAQASENIAKQYSTALAISKIWGNLIVNVKDYGAKGDGKKDDTAAFQAAVDFAYGAGGGTVVAPPGTYMIDAVTSVYLKSNVTLQIDSSATLKALGNSSTVYGVLRATTASNIRIIGGNIVGERNEHTGSTGEQGHGIYMKGVDNLLIEGVKVTNCWGDGIYLGGDLLTPNKPTSEARVINCICDNNRRQGMSITHAKNVTVEGCIFSNTNGTAPESGLDIETNTAESCTGIIVSGNIFTGNRGNGVELSGDVAGDIKAIISNNYCANNLKNGISSTLTSRITISGNTCESNTAAGIRVANSTDNVVSGNVCEQNQNGVLVTASQRAAVTGNVAAFNTSYGIQVNVADNTSINSNNIHDNGQTGIQLITATDCIVSANDVYANSTTTDTTFFNIELKTGSSNNAVLGNVVRAGTAANNPRRGIYISSADCNANLVSNNDCLSGGDTTGITNSGTNTLFGAGNRNKDGTFSTTPN